MRGETAAGHGSNEAWEDMRGEAAAGHVNEAWVDDELETEHYLYVSQRNERREPPITGTILQAKANLHKRLREARGDGAFSNVS